MLFQVQTSVQGRAGVLKRTNDRWMKIGVGVLHSRTQSPSYAWCDEWLWPNPYSELASDWLVLTPDILFLPCFYGIWLWIWPEPLVAPRVRRALGTRMGALLIKHEIFQSLIDLFPQDCWRAGGGREFPVTFELLYRNLLNFFGNIFVNLDF